MAGYDGRGARFNIVAVEGNDLSFTVTAVDSDAAAVDLSAATITGTVYNGSGTAIDTLTDAVSGAGSNIITLSFTDAEVDALVDPKSWALVVERGGDARTWLAGSFTVSGSDRARSGTSGTALTANVDTNVSVTADVLTSAGGVSTLDGLSDVTLTTPTNGQALTYNGSIWVNQTPAGGGDLLAANNLSDVANAATALSNLGGQPLDADLTALAAAGNSSTLANVTAAYTTAEASKLSGIAAGATDDTTVNNHIADTSDAHDASAISVADVATQYTAADVEAALAEVKVIADAAVTPAEAAAAYQPLDADLTALAAAGNSTTLAAVTAAYTTAEASKLAGIEALADVTDTTNVTAAGALMDSEVDADIKTLSLPANTTISAFGATLVDDADNTAARTTLGLGTMATATATDYLAKVAGGASVENIGAVEENVQTVGATGATETLDVSTYGVFDMTMDQNCTFTFSNPAPSGKATSFVLILRGAFTPTLPASIDWSGGSAPTYTTPSVYTFTTVDGGTIWLGTQAGAAFA